MAQDSIINERDCGTDRGIQSTAVVDSGEVILALSARVLGRTIAEDILNPATGELVIARGHEISEEDMELIDNAKVQAIKIRSVLTCESRSGVCGKCYGRDLARGTEVNLGEAVGVLAAQSIGEPGTQLTMRTFHIGGTAQVVNESFIESNHEGIVKIVNRNAAKDSDKRLIVMSRNSTLTIVGEDGVEHAAHKLPYGARLRVDDGDKIGRGDRLAEWDPYTRPIITETAGIVEFEDIVEGVSINEVADEATGITNRVVVDWRATPRGADLRPALAVQDKKGEVIKLKRGGDARYLMSVDAILSVDPGAKVGAGDVLARIPMESAKTRDITGGLPRVAELFEARRPKDCAIIAEIDGFIEFGRDYKNKRRISIRPEDETQETVEYLIPKGKHLQVQEGDFIEKGEYLLDGHPAPHDILAIKGVEELASYLTTEIQEVYRLQGVNINDKHIEVIVRQMLQKMEITSIGDTKFLIGEQVDRFDFADENERVAAKGNTPATGSHVLLGITKASLQTKSFISAASFQETTRVLTEAAVHGKRDTLDGLKENVIVGRLIPAGTGSTLNKFKQVADHRDELILAERAKVAAIAEKKAAAEAKQAAKLADAEAKAEAKADDGEEDAPA